MILRWCKRIGLGLLALVLLLAAAVWFLIGTETGTGWGWSLARGYLPDSVSIETVEGRLLGPLTVTGVTVDTAAARVRIDRLHLAWRPGALRLRRLVVDTLDVDGVDVALKPTEAPAEESPPFEPPEAIELPVAVELRAFELDDFRLRTAPEAEPQVVERLRLAATLADSGWSLRDLEATGPLFDVSGGAELTPRRPYPLEAALDWTARLPDLAPVPGRTRVEGDLTELAVDQRVAEPYNLRAEATLRDIFEALALDARVRLTDTRVAEIRADLPAAGLTADLTARGAPDDLAISGSLAADSPEYGAADLSLEARLTSVALRIEELLLTSPDAAGRLTAAGEVALAADAPMDLTVQWQGLQWPLAGEPTAASPSGQLSVDGTLDGFELAGALDWRLPGRGDGRLELAGDGDLQSLRLETLAVSGDPGRLTGSASVAWAPELSADVTLSGEDVNPGAVVAGWPGRLEVALAASARGTDAGLEAELKRLQVDGRLRDRPVSLAAAARYRPQALTLERLRLRSGEADVRAEGTVGLGETPWDLSWAIDAPKLAALVPGATGRLTGEGRVRGPMAEPRVTGTLEGGEIAYAGTRLDTLSLDADVDVSGARDSRLKLDAGGLRVAGNQVNSLSVDGRGTPGEHRIALTVETPEAAADLAATGAYAEAAWDFTLQQAELASGPLAPLRLTGPADGHVSAARQSLQRACWIADQARLCLQGERKGERFDANAELENLQFSRLQPYLPPDVEISGAVSGKADVQGTLAAPTGRVRLTTSAGELTAREPDGERVSLLAYDPGRLNVDLERERVSLAGELPLAEMAGHVRLDAQVAAPVARLSDGALSGNVDVRVPELAFITELVPEVETIDGRLEGRLALGGSVAAPEIDGELALVAKRLGLVTPGIEMTEVRLAVSGRGDGLDITGSARSGGGQLSVDGHASFPEAGPAVTLNIAGDGFRAMDTREVQLYVSPALDIAVNAEQVRVTGEVTVPRAEITPRNLPASSAVTVSEDQVIVHGDDRPAAAMARALHVDVRLTLGDNVHFEGFGLGADIAGSLAIRQRPGDPATGSGELRIVDGRYRAYGQDLEIRTGRLLFAGGPVSQPGLDVEAVRRPAEDVLVGVRVRGNLRAPDFTLFSEPPMGQSDQLSWLILGRPMEDASSAESGLVNRAALALGLRGGDFLARNVGSRLGLDDVGIETAPGATSEQAALVVGKYLSPKLYVSYGIGLFEPVNTLRLRYTLSPHWRLETESSGAHAGGDIIFSIERP